MHDMSIAVKFATENMSCMRPYHISSTVYAACACAYDSIYSTYTMAYNSIYSILHTAMCLVDEFTCQIASLVEPVIVQTLHVPVSTYQTSIADRICYQTAFGMWSVDKGAHKQTLPIKPLCASLGISINATAGNRNHGMLPTWLSHPHRQTEPLLVRHTLCLHRVCCKHAYYHVQTMLYTRHND